jgi:type I site-specific restriction endonuclease
MSILRPYQKQAVAACWDAIGPDANRALVDMATG